MGLGNLGNSLRGDSGGLGGLGGAGTPARTAPQSDYTRDIIARGSQAIKDRQALAAAGRPTQTQALTYMQQNGIGSQADNDLYNQWYAQQGFQPQQYPVTFGQTAKGNYAGFRTEGELKAAIGGRAEAMRHADQSAAQTDAAGANAQLDDLNSYFDTQGNQAIQDALRGIAPMVDATTEYGKALQHPQRGPVALGISHAIGDTSGQGAQYGPMGQGPTGAPSGLDADAYGMGGAAAQGQVQQASNAGLDAQAKQALDQKLAAATGRENDLVDYTGDLTDWYGRQSEPLVNQLQSDQMRQQVPLAAYGTKAGADYGVDPNLLAGWYDDASTVSDYNTQRNLQSIDQYGLPYSDFNSWVGDQQTAAAAAAKQQTVDQQTAATQASDAQSQQMEDEVYQVTGMDAKQLAQTADLSTPQLYQIVSDPQYQQAANDLGNTLADPDFQNLDSDAQQQAVGQVLDQWRSSPEVYRLLQAQYGAFLN